MLPTFIVIWKSLEDCKIYRTRIERTSKLFVKCIYDNPKFDSKLLYLFRVKTFKYGSMSVPQLH